MPTTTRRVTFGIIGLALIGVYSLIMTASDGEAATWAWLLLIASAVLIWAAAAGARRHDG